MSASAAPGRARRAACSIVAACALAAMGVRAESLRVDIEGLEDESLEAAVRSALDVSEYTDRKVSEAQARRVHARGEPQVRAALEPYGYYHAEVDAELTTEGETLVSRWRIAPGEPTRVTERSLRIDPAPLAVREISRAWKRFRPREGEVLDHARYEKSKQDVQSALIAHGWLDAELERRRVEVTRATRSARIDLAWRVGERYRFGETRFPDTQFREGFLARYVPWREGDHFDQSQLLELQQRLVDADYFSVVEVLPRLEGAADGRVPVDLILVRAPRTVYTGGVFAGTDSGLGVRAAFDRRWVNDRGHKLRVSTELSQRLSDLTALYTIPRPGPDNRRWQFAASFRDEQTDTSESRVLRLGAQQAREWRGFTHTVGVQFLTGDFTIADEEGSSTLLFPEVTATRKDADDIDFPRRGWSATAALRGAQEGLLSDTSFVQLRVDGKWIRGLGERNRFIARGSAGTMWVRDFDALPPELRFFAGGDRSVRGFDYQAIGTRNARGKVIGGEHLLVASAELEHYFKPQWGAAVFVDAGDAFTGTDFDASVGAGVGVRWRSPVGLVRLDVAVPVRGEESGFGLHLTIGPDL